MCCMSVEGKYIYSILFYSILFYSTSRGGAAPLERDQTYFKGAGQHQ